MEFLWFRFEAKLRKYMFIECPFLVMLVQVESGQLSMRCKYVYDLVFVLNVLH